MRWIKICGITNLEDAERAVSLGTDALGFVFAESRRRIEPEEAKRIIAALPRKVEKIGVFYNQDLSEVRRIGEYCRLDYFQLHGEESMEYCRALAPGRIIKGIRVRKPEDSANYERYFTVKNVERILLDSFVEGNPGGTGERLNWRDWQEKLLQIPLPVIIAGGINKDNLIELQRELKPWGIDLSSGVEQAPGKKDKKKLEELFALYKEIRKSEKSFRGDGEL